MAAGLITELDASDVSRNVLTEVYDTDKHAQATVIYANGSLVATLNPLPVTDLSNVTVQSAITGAGSAGGATSLAKKPGVTPGSVDLGTNLVAIRTDDSSSDVAEDDGEWTPLRASSRGGLYMEMSGALDSDIDSIYARPYGQGGVPTTYSKRFTTTAAEIAIAAPGAGFRLVITNCRISCRSTVAGQITVFQDTDADGAYDVGEPCVADDDYAPTTAQPVGSKSGPLHVVFAENKRCYVLSSAAINFTLMLDYIIEPMPA